MRYAETLSLGIAVILALAAGRASAEPNWTKTGDCTACHTTMLSGVVDVYGHGGMSDPDGSGPRDPLKVFRVQRERTKSLMVRLDGLGPKDRYAAALTQVRNLGLTGGTLSYYADCAWSQWWGTFFTDPTFYYRWNAGPTEFKFDLQPTADASFDAYELVFAVAGINDDTNQLFYAEEHFLLQVLPEGLAPPRVTSAVSRRRHGAAGEFDVDLMPAGGQLAFEGRIGGPKNIIVTFSEPIQAATASPSDVALSSSAGSPGAITGVSVSGAQLLIALDGVPEMARLTLSFPGITGLQGMPAMETICLGTLTGDVNGDGLTNVLDLISVRNVQSSRVDQDVFRADVNTDGAVNALDLIRVRNVMNRNANGSCP